MGCCSCKSLKKIEMQRSGVKVLVTFSRFQYEKGKLVQGEVERQTGTKIEKRRRER
jgi:hypothetical protein